MPLCKLTFVFCFSKDVGNDEMRKREEVQVVGGRMGGGGSSSSRGSVGSRKLLGDGGSGGGVEGKKGGEGAPLRVEVKAACGCAGALVLNLCRLVRSRDPVLRLVRAEGEMGEWW